MKILILRNRQQTQKIDLHFLRKIIRALLQELLQQNDYELGLHLIDAEEMASVNETFLQHGGSTDVITFNYAEERAAMRPAGSGKRGSPRAPASGTHGSTLAAMSELPQLHGELFISVDDAIAQAKEFRTTWPSELVRYLVHGILHLQGYDDVNSTVRKKMKREENRLLKELSRRFPLEKLGGSNVARHKLGTQIESRREFDRLQNVRSNKA